jgi:hypothetical protein
MPSHVEQLVVFVTTANTRLFQHSIENCAFYTSIHILKFIRPVVFTSCKFPCMDLSENFSYFSVFPKIHNWDFLTGNIAISQPGK